MVDQVAMETQQPARTFRRRASDVMPDASVEATAIVNEVMAETTPQDAPTPNADDVARSNATLLQKLAGAPRVLEQYQLARLFGGTEATIPLGGTVKIEELEVYKPFAATNALDELIKMNVLERFEDGTVGRGIKWDEYLNLNGQHPPTLVTA